MSSLRETLLQAVVAALTGATPAGARVYRTRTQAVVRGETPLIAVQPTTEAVTRLARDIDQRDLSVQIAIYTRGDSPDMLADPVAVAAHAAMMADPTFGGIAGQVIEQESGWEFDDEDQSGGILTMPYVIRYATTAGSLTRKP